MKQLLLVALLAGCTGFGAPAEPPSATTNKQVELHGFTLELEPARLFAPSYARYRLHGEELVEIPDRYPKSCYYSGRVRGEVGSRIAIRACDADFSDATGLVLTGGDAWFIDANGLQPAQGPSGTCATRSPPDRELLPPSNIAPTDTDTRTRRQALSLEPRFVEMLAVEDSALTEHRDNGGVTPDVPLAVHMAAALYDAADFEDRVLPLLTAYVDTGGSDPWGAPQTSGGEALSEPYLNAFNAWLLRSSQLPAHDHATLFTAWDLDGATVGLANEEGACNPEYSGVLVDSVGRDDVVAATTAHELGHSLGMSHDGEFNNCAQSGFIMAWVFDGGAGETEFSTCSIADGDAWLGSGGAWCIDRESQPAHDAPVCGDGKVDAGEQCDCGPQGCAGRDPCCNESTCQLVADALCSVIDGCCDESTCQPISAAANVECRPATSTCDVAETCDGGARCPLDQYNPTGMSCTEGSWSGSCMTGVCVTRGGICEAISDDWVLDPVPYDPMCADAGCIVMDCVYQNACVTTGYGTPDGTPCGNGQQCWQGSCVASSTLPGADGCSQPNLDSDSDGTRDCDDACPFDPDTTSMPCAQVEVPPPTGGPDVGGGGNNGGGPDMGGGSTTSNDPVIVIDESDEGGCTVGSGRATATPLGLLVFLAMLRLRRRQRR